MPRDELIFGLHAVMAALKYEPERLRVIWVDHNRRDARLRLLLEEAGRQGIAIHWESRETLDRMSGGSHHQGVVVRCVTSKVTRGEKDLHGLLASAEGPALLLVLDGVQDPHNLGACLRCADAAGVHAVLAPADRAVGLNATVRKVACGAAETVPFIQVTNLARALRHLQEWGLWVIGATAEAEKTLYEVDLSGPLALVLGSEEKGLRRLTREVCDSLARIPMTGRGESLNVSVAAGIFLFEAVRQRKVGRDHRPGQG
jgi:23S rRNA (guanosine2251-2'-O)-methyltransferase